MESTYYFLLEHCLESAPLQRLLQGLPLFVILMGEGKANAE